jgi:two-component system response regulator ChvI
MSKPALLLVDDDVALSGVLAAALDEEGFDVTTARDGREGLARFLAGRFDLAVLDVLMPELDGLELCRRLRQTSKVPVIFLTSRADEVDRITGLETGADDYVAKPFSTRELVARIRAVLRRTGTADAPGDPVTAKLLEVGELTIDSGRFEVSWKGHPTTLTRSEFLVLSALARHPGFVLSRERLIDLARGDEVVITERTIDTFIKRIRQKLHALDPAFDAIETVVGVGYRLKAPR